MTSSAGSGVLSRGVPRRNSAEDKQGRSAKTTCAAFGTLFTPNAKLSRLLVMLTLFVCLISSAHCSTVIDDQGLDNRLEMDDQFIGGDHGNYFDESIGVNHLERNQKTAGGNGDKQVATIHKLREVMQRTDSRVSVQHMPREGAIQQAPVSLKAEINFRLIDLKNFLKSLVFTAVTSNADRSKADSTSRRSTRDTEAQTSSDSSAPWTSNLSPAAVVGAIVGGTVAIFVIVVLGAIFCSYRNYESLEIRRRTAEVFEHHSHNSVHPV